MATMQTSVLRRPMPRRREATSYTEQLIAAALDTGVDASIESSNPVPWKAGLQLLQSEDAGIRRLGSALAVQAIIRTPEAVASLSNEVFAALSAGVPTLDF